MRSLERVCTGRKAEFLRATSNALQALSPSATASTSIKRTH